MDANQQDDVQTEDGARPRTENRPKTVTLAEKGITNASTGTAQAMTGGNRYSVTINVDLTSNSSKWQTVRLCGPKVSVLEAVRLGVVSTRDAVCIDIEMKRRQHRTEQITREVTGFTLQALVSTEVYVFSIDGRRVA